LRWSVAFRGGPSSPDNDHDDHPGHNRAHEYRRNSYNHYPYDNHHAYYRGLTMTAEPACSRRAKAFRSLSELHRCGLRGEEVYRGLLEKYCERTSDEQFWCFSKARPATIPRQGFKLHISATILSANETFARCAPYLDGQHILYKVPPSLRALSQLNSGLYYGVSQIGKFITVYPRDNVQAVSAAEALHSLTVGLPAPCVPFDRPLRAGSCVFYRFGTFGSVTAKNGAVVDDCLEKPSGRRVRDKRAFGAAVPSWVENPFSMSPEDSFRPKRFSRYCAFEALSQRGKGGVYRAFDISVLPFREVILKEGRRHGEVDLDERDGYWRIGHESEVLAEIGDLGIPVPGVVESFELDDSRYLALEKVEGINLDTWMQRRKSKLTFDEFVRIGLGIANIVSQLHAAGWAWRDCKPLNVILQPDGRIRAIDFEGACHIGVTDETPWGSPGYKPLAWTDLIVDPLQEDLYALGATLFHMVSGAPLFDYARRDSVLKVRRGFPREVKQAIHSLLDHDPAKRPSAQDVARELSFL
jgi:tRNA A-37 threonylcarbamoyl transferase component Bud32